MPFEINNILTGEEILNTRFLVKEKSKQKHSLFFQKKQYKILE
jgi:hypothetical protein